VTSDSKINIFDSYEGSNIQSDVDGALDKGLAAINGVTGVTGMQKKIDDLTASLDILNSTPSPSPDTTKPKSDKKEGGMGLSDILAMLKDGPGAIKDHLVSTFIQPIKDFFKQIGQLLGVVNPDAAKQVEAFSNQIDAMADDVIGGITGSMPEQKTPTPDSQSNIDPLERQAMENISIVARKLNQGSSAQGGVVSLMQKIEDGSTNLSPNFATLTQRITEVPTISTNDDLTKKVEEIMQSSEDPDVIAAQIFKLAEQAQKMGEPVLASTPPKLGNT
tara:strand:- start:1995 stop:2822 length:828 start_codon:yes stop_codon:yes gene_type:complete